MNALGAITENFFRVNACIDGLRASQGITRPIKLVAVSKLQPRESIEELYNAGHRDFGENYVDELYEKALSLPVDINWHMIGHLQSNKCKKLLSIPNLKSIHSIDSASLATKVNKYLIPDNTPLSVFIQVNTSGELSKSGLDPSKLLETGRYIRQNCPKLKLAGLMTIGETGNIQDFVLLKQLRKNLAESLELDENAFELSMGMSGDYEQAIIHGSSYVRIGTTIFGPRPH
jgi:PLP dependent protein